MNILIVPDVHGRKFWEPAKELVTKVDKVVFLGDFLDPYYPEGINMDEALINLDDIIEFRDANVDKVITLIGNHDIHYLTDGIEHSSRFDGSRYNLANDMLKKLDFKLIYINEKCLFSHAGVTKEWLSYCNLKFEDLDKKSVISLKNDLWVVGQMRGGYATTGSCIWCDIREFQSSKEKLPYYQIFGHTQLNSEYITKEFADLDCRSLFTINTETCEIKKV